MNISFEKQDAVNGELTVVVSPEDYQEKYAKSLKDYAKKAQMPGFRAGHVPMGLVKKQMGPALLMDTVNMLLQENLFNYIREEKIEMLGEPIPAEENNDVAIAEGNEFTFKFGIALAPEFDLALGKKDKVAYYRVQVDDKQVEDQVNVYRQRGGKYDKVESYIDNDMLKGNIAELDAKGEEVAEGVKAEAVVMLPKYFKSDDQKKLFDGKKVGDTVVFNPSKAYDGSESELGYLLHVEKEKAKEYTGDFAYTITEITRYMPGPVDQKLFDDIYPGAGITSEGEFKAKIKEGIQEQFDKDADYKFLLDVRKYCADKVGKLQFPDEKLKTIMNANTKDEAKVEENYDKSIEELTWHLMKEKLVAQTGVKVEDTDVRHMAEEVTKMRFAQYGMLNIPQEYIDNAVKEMLKSRESVDNLIDRTIELKLGTALKDVVTLDEKSVTSEEFNKLF